MQPLQDTLPPEVRRWMLSALDHTILITDKQLNVLGDPILNWTTLDVTLRWNEPGSGLFTVPGYPWIREMLEAGSQVVVLRNRSVLISGPYENSLYERSDDGENAGVGMLTVNFADDLARVVARQTYPNPAQSPETQDADVWTFTGNAEVALRTAVNANAGPGALTARQVPNLALGTLAGVGSTITLTAQRMEPLGDVLRRGATAGGDLGFRARQLDDFIRFEVYQPQDLSEEVRFSFGLGNLRYVGYERSAPKVNAAIVGGQGTGADRALIERVNTASQTAWGRMETLISRPGNAPLAELQADGDEALAEGGETVRLQVNAVDTPDQRFGLHYGLGDVVAIEPWHGTQIADKVVTVHIQVYPTAGEIIQPTIGSQAASSDPAWIRRLRQIDSRVGRIERQLDPTRPA